MTGMKRLLGLAALTGLAISSCGRDSNFNQIFRTSDDDKRVDTLVALGRIHFDRGEHNKAAKYAKEAYDINHNSEKAAILYSYVLLGQVGIDPFSMTKSMIDKNSKKSTAAAALAEDSTGSGAEALTQFSSLINIEEDDIKRMGEYEESTNSFFANYPIFIPKKPGAEDGPRSFNKTLVNISKAVEVICPFVSSGARVEGYKFNECDNATGYMEYQSKSHFLWALAHLSEALAFNSVLLYDGGDGKAASLTAETSTPDTGLFRRVSALEAKKTFEGDEISDYVKSVAELKGNIEAIFDTSEESMLYATLSDLTAVSLGFASIAGIPDSVTSKITAGLKTIQALGEKLSKSADSALSAQTEALKLQMNTNVNEKLKTSIEAFNKQYADEDAVAQLPQEQQDKIAENKENLCTTYKDLSGYSSGDKTVALPTGC